MKAFSLSAFAIAGVAAQADVYTATKSADVAAAQATAKTSQPISNVNGKVSRSKARYKTCLSDSICRSSIVS